MRRTKPIHIATVIAATIFAVVVLIGVVFFAGIWRFGSSYDVSAYVDNARGIAPDSTAFEAGLPVGVVTGVRRHGPDAILSLRIDSGPRPLPVDTTVQLGLRSLAGEADVLLRPGHATELVPSGGSLGLARDQSYTEVDQILQTLSGDTEGAARQFIQGLGGGVAGEGTNLNQTLGGAAGLINNSPPVTGTLGAQHAQVAEIVEQLGGVMDAIGQRGDAIRQFATGSTITFRAIAARDTELRRLLVHLPSALDGVRALGQALSESSPAIDPVLGNLGAAPYGQSSHELMLSALVDPSTFIRGVDSQPVNNALTTLLNFGIFRQLGGRSGYDALPGPGQNANTTNGAGENGTFAYGATHKYPHVTADCAK